jgi:hypothetical protein
VRRDLQVAGLLGNYQKFVDALAADLHADRGPRLDLGVVAAQPVELRPRAGVDHADVAGPGDLDRQRERLALLDARAVDRAEIA